MTKNFSTKFITAYIVGGLGNQLFQIANVLTYAWKYSLTPVFKKIQRSPSFGSPKIVYWKTVFRKLPLIEQLPSKLAIFKEKDKSYHELPSPKKILTLRKNKGIIFYGYFQSARYFNNFREKLLANLFYFEPSEKEYIKKKYTRIFNEDIITVALHIRRGDYLKLSNRFINLSETNYYQKSITYFQEKLSKYKLIFVIFSDDQDWSRNYMKTKFPRLNQIFPIEKDYLELYLMSCCNHQIIANSSFSWWAAYLNNFPKKIVVAPKKWFGSHGKPKHDLYMDSWIKF